MIIDTFIKIWEGFFYVFANNEKNPAGIIKVQEKDATMFSDNISRTLHLVEITYDSGHTEFWSFGKDKELRDKIYQTIVEHQTDKYTFDPNYPINTDGKMQVC
jgi:hypothetical protein